MEFLLSHHTTDDTDRDFRADASLERSVGAIYDPDIPGSDKNRFVTRLKEDLEQIRAANKGRTPGDDDVARIVDQLKEIVRRDQEQNGQVLCVLNFRRTRYKRACSTSAYIDVSLSLHLSSSALHSNLSVEDPRERLLPDPNPQYPAFSSSVQVQVDEVIT